MHYPVYILCALSHYAIQIYQTKNFHWAPLPNDEWGYLHGANTRISPGFGDIHICCIIKITAHDEEGFPLTVAFQSEEIVYKSDDSHRNTHSCLHQYTAPNVKYTVHCTHPRQWGTLVVLCVCRGLLRDVVTILAVLEKCYSLRSSFDMYNLESQLWYLHLLTRHCPYNLLPEPSSPKHEYRGKLWGQPVTSSMTSSPWKFFLA